MQLLSNSSMHGTAAQQGAGSGAQRLHLEIDGEIVVQALSRPHHKAKSKIIGAVHGEMILIGEPKVSINHRLSVLLEGDFVCSYFHAGYLYHFHSRYRKHLSAGIVAIDYPPAYDVQKIRSHSRVRVNLETRLFAPGVVAPVTGTMQDISGGGCCVALPAFHHVVRGMRVALVFRLPSDLVIEGLQCEVVRVRYCRKREATEAGLRFLGPAAELSKVEVFCEFCMFFEV